MNLAVSSLVLNINYAHLSVEKDQSANFKNQCNALGSYHEQESIEISREQFEYLKEIWK